MVDLVKYLLGIYTLNLRGHQKVPFSSPVCRRGSEIYFIKYDVKTERYWGYFNKTQYGVNIIIINIYA